MPDDSAVLDLGFADTAGDEALVPDARVVLRPVRARASPLGLPHSARATRLRAAVPAVPSRRVPFRIEVTSSRWHSKTSGLVTPAGSETVSRTLTLWRQPSKWTAKCVPFARLDDAVFRTLRGLLDASRPLVVRAGRRRDVVPALTGSAYNNASEAEATRLAKVGLLNLYAKLRLTRDPVEARPWLRFLRQIVEIRRDRIIAVADPGLERVVRSILDDPDRHPTYKRAKASNHHGNIPKGFGVSPLRMFSIKSREDLGNLQLTLAKGREPSGQPILFLDADIDEHGRWVEHVLDVLGHAVTGKKTHPHHIHEALRLLHPRDDFGYRLE